MAKKKKSSEYVRSNDNNKIIKGVLGVVLSIIGLLSAFKTGASNTLLFIIYLIVIVIGIILVAKALSD